MTREHYTREEILLLLGFLKQSLRELKETSEYDLVDLLNEFDQRIPTLRPADDTHTEAPDAPAPGPDRSAEGEAERIAWA